MREDAEALRRRLYSRGASEADLERYRQAGGTAEPGGGRVEPTSAAPRAPRVPARRRGLRAAVVAVVAVAVLGGGIAVSRLTAGSRPAAPTPTPIAMSERDRSGLRQNLALGDYAGIAAFLVTHRAPESLQTATRADTVERTGVGDGTVSLSPVSAQAVSGRVTVLVVLAESANADWTTLRRSMDPSGEQRYVRQVQRAGPQEAGVLTTHTYRYSSGDRPIELRVSAPDGVRWGAAAVFTD